MPEDNIVVPQGQASTKELVQPAGEVAPTTTKPSETQPLTAEAIQKMVEEATAKAVAQAKDIGRRELQSEQDRNKAALLKAQREAGLAQNTLRTTRARMQSIDPKLAEEMELAELRSKDFAYQQAEQEEALIKQQTEFHNQFQSGLTQFVTNLGLDPKDTRIDWAGDAPNYLAAQQRVLDSVAKIQKENMQTMQSGLEKRLKEIEAKVGKVSTDANIEANSVNTTTSQGVVAGSDAEFVKKFGTGELPMTKANVDRYNKIQNTY